LAYWNRERDERLYPGSIALPRYLIFEFQRRKSLIIALFASIRVSGKGFRKLLGGSQKWSCPTIESSNIYPAVPRTVSSLPAALFASLPVGFAASTTHVISLGGRSFFRRIFDRSTVLIDQIIGRSCRSRHPTEIDRQQGRRPPPAAVNALFLTLDIRGSISNGLFVLVDSCRYASRFF